MMLGWREGISFVSWKYPSTMVDSSSRNSGKDGKSTIV